MGFDKSEHQSAYWNSLEMTIPIVRDIAIFLEVVAKKLTRASHAALSAYVSNNKIEISEEKQKALNFLLWEDRVNPQDL